MYCIMHAAVKQVAEDKTGKKTKAVCMHQQVHNTEDRGGDDDAGNRGHEEPFLVTREMMMVPVHDINEFLRLFAFCYGMKGEPVHQVFEECPEKATRKKQGGNA